MDIILLIGFFLLVFGSSVIWWVSAAAFIEVGKTTPEVFRTECDAPWQYVLMAYLLLPIVIGWCIKKVALKFKPVRWFFGVKEEDNA